MHGARVGSHPVAREAPGSPPPSPGVAWHEINTVLCLYPRETRASVGEVIHGRELGGWFGIQDVPSGFALPRSDAADSRKPDKMIFWLSLCNS